MGKMDLWYGFACHGIDLLRKNGTLCFIAQNNWTTSSGAKLMRKKILNDSKIRQLLDFNSYMVFENADIQTMVMIFEHTKNEDNYFFDYRTLQGIPTKDDMIALLNKQKSVNTKYLLPKIIRNNYINKLLTFSENDVILDKIAEEKSYLTEDEIAQGIVPNPDVINSRNIKLLKDKTINIGDGVFVVDSRKFPNPTKKELNYIKPLYEPYQMTKYYMSPITEKRLLYITKANWKNDTPRILNHLSKYKEIMEQRRENQNGRIQFMHLHWARDEKFFQIGPKILSVRKCVDMPIFVYYEPEAYVMMSVNVIKTDRWNMKFLTGILNSRLIAFWLKNKGKMQGNNYQIDKEPLMSIPLPIANTNQQKPIIDLVDKILSIKKDDLLATVDSLQQKIDSLVYDLYNLGTEDIAIIEKSINC